MVSQLKVKNPYNIFSINISDQNVNVFSFEKCHKTHMGVVYIYIITVIGFTMLYELKITSTEQ